MSLIIPEISTNLNSTRNNRRFVQDPYIYLFISEYLKSNYSEISDMSCTLEDRVLAWNAGTPCRNTCNSLPYWAQNWRILELFNAITQEQFMQKLR